MGSSPLGLLKIDSGSPAGLYGFYNGSVGILCKSWAWSFYEAAIGSGCVGSFQ